MEPQKVMSIMYTDVIANSVKELEDIGAVIISVTINPLHTTRREYVITYAI